MVFIAISAICLLMSEETKIIADMNDYDMS